MAALVSTEWLQARLGDEGLRVVDVRWTLGAPERGAESYRAGHLPGAVFLDVEHDLAAPGGGRGLPAGRHPWPPPEQVARVMSAAGIGPGVTVVAYDDQAGATAARLWFLLRAHGHEEAAVLDGGLAKWLAERRPTTTDVPAVAPAVFEPRLRPELLVFKPEMVAGHAGELVLDARAGERYRGEFEPIDPRAGHVPGALSAPFSENLTAGPLPVFRPPPTCASATLRWARRSVRRSSTAARASRPATTSWRCTWPASPAGSTRARGASGRATRRSRPPPAQRPRSPAPGLPGCPGVPRALRVAARRRLARGDMAMSRAAIPSALPSAQIRGGTCGRTPGDRRTRGGAMSSLGGVASLAAVVTLALAAGTLTPPAGAAEPPVATVEQGADGLTWTPASACERLQLTVNGPGEWTLERQFDGGAPAVLALVDEGGQRLADGAYTWDLICAARRDALAAVRESQDPARAVQPLERAARSSAQAGSFTVAGGRLVAPGRREPRRAAAATLATGPAPNQSIVESLCVGFDCPTSPSFGDTTILTMENNLRLKFDDTSTLAGFSNRDWSLNANDSPSGGLNRFWIQDCGTSSQGDCTGNAVLSIEGGAPANALYVDDAGRVGLGLSTPVLDLHLRSGNSPGLRFEQDDSYGWGAQTWDVVGNETNWFVRDVTSGSRLPLRIRPGAPTDSLHVYSDGKVGLGTNAPAASLHVRGSSGSTLVQVEETSATTSARNLLRLVNKGAATIRIDNSALTNNWGFGTNSANNFFITNSSAGGLNLTLTSGGVLTVTDLIESSDRALKEQIEAVDGHELLARLATLPIATWRFKDVDARHIGPMAQDFQASFGLGPDDRHIRPGDVAGVALAAVQTLSQLVAEKDSRLVAQEARLEELAARLAVLEATLDDRRR